MTEEVGNEDEKNLNVEKPLGEEDAAENVEKEGTKEENEEKPEDKVKNLKLFVEAFDLCYSSYLCPMKVSIFMADTTFLFFDLGITTTPLTLTLML